MIKITCDNCGQRIKVSDEHAGKGGKCPKCENRVTIPKIDGGIELQPVLKQAEVPEEKHEAEYYLPQRTVDDDKETGERKLPWPIDIWLYPISASGVTNLGMFLATAVIVRFINFGMAGFLLGRIISFIMGLYFFWYVTECIRDSAGGGTRAPEVIGSRGDDLGGLFETYGYMLTCWLICFMPIIMYTGFTGRRDGIYWGLWIYCAVLFPILFLAVITLESSAAYNPILLIIAMFKTFLTYVLVVAVFFGFIVVIHLLPAVENKFAAFLAGVVILYLVFVGAHLLGRFYWLNRFRLDWG